MLFMSRLDQVEALRKNRGSAARDVSIATIIVDTAADASRTHKKLGEMIELWEQLVPAELASHTSLTGLHRGILHVVVDSSSAAFELDRLMRSGLADQLRERFRGTLVRVKTRTGTAT